MKTNPFQAGRTHQAVRLAVLGAGIAGLMPATTLAEGDNYIELSAGGIATSGNEAAYQRRYQNNGDFYGGIKALHFEQVGDKGTFELDAHAMPGLEDYGVDLSYTLDDVGFIRGGFRQFRTWYDGSGGYLPGYGAGPGWLDPITPYNDELEIDRGTIFFEAGLRMPDIPQITFGYEHSWRDGNKDSTFWQRANEAKGFGTGAYPGLYRIDEVSDIFRLDVTHTLGNTDLGAGLRFRTVHNDDVHYTRYGGGGGATLTQDDINEYDMWSGHLYSTTRFCDERAMLSFGYNITSLNSDIGGYRTVNHAYTNLMGGSESLTQTFNASLWWNPIDDLVIVPSFRAECWNQDTWGGHLDPANILDSSAYESSEQTYACEVRYSGLNNLLLYGRAEYSHLNGDMWRTDLDNGVVQGMRATDSTIERQKYVVGANWYPTPGLSVAAQYFYREYDQGFSHIYSGDDAQLLGHVNQTNDANLRVTWRALPNLSFVTRYDYTVSAIDNQAVNNLNLPTIPTQSAEITKHVFTESVSWNPLEQLYMQLGVHYIISETDTPADQVIPTMLTDWDNDYWSLSFNAGYAFSANTELHAGYYYYHADNYVNNVAFTIPYGTVSDEHALSIGLTQRINDNLLWNLDYGYYRGSDAAAGGYNNYEAHVLSTGIRLSF